MMSTRPRCPGRREHGFTLLEVLVAVTLLGLLIAMAVGSLRTAVGTTRSGERTINWTNQTRTVQMFLRQQLSHAMALPFEFAEDLSESRMFIADANELRFVAPMPGHLASGGPHVQWITISGSELLFDHAQLNGYDQADPKASNPREPVFLIGGIARASFEYRGLDEDGELDDWAPGWDEVGQLPLMVRLVVEFEEPRREWPDLEVAVLTGSAVPNASLRPPPFHRQAPPQDSRRGRQRTSR